MRKRMSACALALCMACVLCACGGSGDTPAPPAADPTPPPVEDVTPPEVSQPSDFSEPDDIQEPVEPEPEKIEGLIFVNSRVTTSQKVERDVYCFNPETGKETLIASFPFSLIPDGNSNECYHDMSTDTSLVASIRQSMFSSDYSKMALTKKCANGEHHAGWLDSNGNFFDVSEALGLQSKSDFDNLVHSYSTGFADNMFGFKQTTDFRKYNWSCVPIDNVTISAVQEEDAIEVVYPALTNYERGGLRNEITSWIDDSHSIVNDISNMPVSVDSSIVDITTMEWTKYIPGDARDNWNGCISPDKTKIAFMSSRGYSKEVYIVPVNGGDPVKVTGYSFPLASYSYSFENQDHYNMDQEPLRGEGYILIDWI